LRSKQRLQLRLARRKTTTPLAPEGEEERVDACVGFDLGLLCHRIPLRGEDDEVYGPFGCRPSKSWWSAMIEREGIGNENVGLPASDFPRSSRTARQRELAQEEPSIIFHSRRSQASAGPGLALILGPVRHRIPRLKEDDEVYCHNGKDPLIACCDHLNPGGCQHETLRSGFEFWGKCRVLFLKPPVDLEDGSEF
jgi:hypothetical protein